MPAADLPPFPDPWRSWLIAVFMAGRIGEKRAWFQEKCVELNALVARSWVT